MTAEAQDVTMYQGTDMVLTISVVDAAGAPKNLTGASITWKLAYGPNNSSALLTKTVGAGVAITNAAGGVFTVTLADTETDSLEGEFYHEAKVTDGTGNESVVTAGHITIKAALT